MTEEIRRKRIADIVEAVGSWEIMEHESDARNDLDGLSNRTEVDAVEIFEDEIQEREGEFIGPLVVYVTLNYGNDDVTMTEAFPGQFTAIIEDDGNPMIQDIKVDVSGFYEAVMLDED